MLYILQGELYRDKNKFDQPIQIYKEFRDENILNARKKCFDAFHSYLDVLLESMELEYINYEQAVNDLKKFYESDLQLTKKGLPLVQIGMGINISFVHNDKIEYTSKETNVNFYKGIKVIHGIEFELDDEIQYEDKLINIYFKNLLFEYKFLKKKGVEIPDEILDDYYKIIKTPIDYSK